LSTLSPLQPLSSVAKKASERVFFIQAIDVMIKPVSKAARAALAKASPLPRGSAAPPH
jgi:hypothetical protein